MSIIYKKSKAWAASTNILKVYCFMETKLSDTSQLPDTAAGPTCSCNNIYL